MRRQFSVLGIQFSENGKQETGNPRKCYGKTLQFVALTQARKGGLHTLEAIIAFLMVLTFIIMVMPSLQKEDNSAMAMRNYVYGSLSSLEKTGKLRELAVAENLSGIYLELNRTILPPLKFTVGISKMNSTYGTIFPKELQSVPAYINFTADKSTLDSAALELNYINATSPIVYVNGNEAAYRAGDYSGKSEVLDISGGIVSGANSVMVKTSNNATISYRLRLQNSLELEGRPANKTINTATYVVSGDKNMFKPAEIRVYFWRS